MTITVFGSSRCAEGSEEYKLAYELGRAIAAAGHSVCNGGFGGTMEACARGAKEAGGSTIGVTIQLFGQSANPWIDQTIRTNTLVERLLKLIELGDAFVTLRGGTGTLLELAAVWEMMNKGIIPARPLLTFEPFWTPLIRMMAEELYVWPTGSPVIVQQVRTPEECARALEELLPKT
ncbi:MAG: LOG family protein [Bacteroidota bacterium]